MKRTLYNFFFKVVIFLSVSTFLWFRFLRPRVVGPVDFTYSSIKISLYFLGIFISLIILFFMVIRPFFIIYTGPEKNSEKTWFAQTKQVYFDYIFNKYIQILQKPLVSKLIKHFDNVILNVKTVINDSFEVLVIKHFGEPWLKFLHQVCLLSVNPYWPKLIGLLLYVPALLFSIIFFIETVIFHYRYFYIYFIPFTLVPLCLRILLYFFQETCEKIEKAYMQILRCQDVDGQLGYFWAFNCVIPEQYRTLELLQVYVNQSLENEQKKSALDQWHTFFKNNIYRPFFVSLTCIFWISSFSYLVYMLLK